MATSIARLVSHHRIGIGLTFEPGALDPATLLRAARLSLIAEPMAACSFSTEGWRAHWVAPSDVESLTVFDCVVSDEPEAAMDAFQAQELPDDGPQVAVRLFRGPGADLLGIKVSHVLADGQAGKQYAYRLAEICSRLTQNPRYCPEANRNARPSGTDVWRHLTPQQRRAARRAKSWVRPTWVVPGASSSGGGLAYLTAFVEPDAFRQARAWGRQRGATVNDLLLTAVFRSCVRLLDPPVGQPLSLMCTADLRRYLPSSDRLPLANLSISGSLEIERIDGERFEQTMSRVQQRMGVWAEQCYGAAPFAGAERLAGLGYPVMKALLGLALNPPSKSRGAASRKTYPWFTNIGVLDEARLSFADALPLAGHMYGPCAKGPSIVPVVSTYRDRLAICTGVCAHDMDVSLAETFLADTVGELTAASA